MLREREEESLLLKSTISPLKVFKQAHGLTSVLQSHPTKSVSAVT